MITFSFMRSLLPYTPDVLRHANSAMLEQIESQKTVRKAVEIMYRTVVKVETYHILKLSTFRKKIKHCWEEIKKMIYEDLHEHGTAIDRKLDCQEFDIMTIRKWM